MIKSGWSRVYFIVVIRYCLVFVAFIVSGFAAAVYASGKNTFLH